MICMAAHELIIIGTAFYLHTLNKRIKRRCPPRGMTGEVEDLSVAASSHWDRMRCPGGPRRCRRRTNGPPYPGVHGLDLVGGAELGDMLVGQNLDGER